MEQEFLTVKEFADRLKMHYNTVLKSIHKGRINAFRINEGVKASYRIPSSELNRLGLFQLESVVNKLVDERIKREE